MKYRSWPDDVEKSMERSVDSRGTTRRNSIHPHVDLFEKGNDNKIKHSESKRGRGKGQRRTCSWCPCCQQTAHSRTTSLRILYIGGWNHSDLEFIISLCDLLIITPSLTCLLMLSLFDFVTFALNWLSSPRWFSSICFLTKHDSLSSVPSLCSPPRCSFALVYRFLDVSPIYTGLCPSGQSPHSIS